MHGSRLARPALAVLLTCGVAAAGCDAGNPGFKPKPSNSTPASTATNTDTRSASFSATVEPQKPQCKGWIVHVRFVPGVPPAGGDSFNAIAYYTVTFEGNVVGTGKLDKDNQKADIYVVADPGSKVPKPEIHVYRIEQRKGGPVPANPGGNTPVHNPAPCK